MLSSSSSSCLTTARMALAIVLVAIFLGSSSAHLSTKFYSKSCPILFGTVKSVVTSAVNKEKRMGASLLRLHFHDCFVQGCDGSILLDDTSYFKGEKIAFPNNNSVRGYNVIDDIKNAVEEVCPGIVSCADIIAIAARDSTVLLGGPTWNVKLGRRDSKTANLNVANTPGVLPSPFSNLSALISSFQNQGLSTRDLVALSGAHTIGKTRCTIFRDRIYKDTNTIAASFAKKRQRKCPRETGSGDDNLAPLDLETPAFFDNYYYKNLINKKGLLHSDQALYSGGSTDSLVKKYSKNPALFNSHFARAMIKMGNIRPLTGSCGEIRKNCRIAN
ncbi:peroxidase 4-like [Ipomoea triloba]|uniref:peroxidase 4-like n=1 Tax=Ipomoea triloba TaxID=35885 RepID=UPI00125D3600|nr:peroxidase 4-like [Ipomoea triloba]